jgi:predicted membrane protein
MSSTRRVGRWAVPRDLRFIAMMADSKLDLTSAALPVGGVVNIEITAVMASVRIIVPPGMRVINEMHSFLSDVGSSADEVDNERGNSPVVRLTGTAFMADMKVKVRRREEPVFDDED